MAIRFDLGLDGREGRPDLGLLCAAAPFAPSGTALGQTTAQVPASVPADSVPRLRTRR